MSRVRRIIATRLVLEQLWGLSALNEPGHWSKFPPCLKARVRKGHSPREFL